MKIVERFVLLVTAISLQIATVQAKPDSLWLYRDSIPENYRYYAEIELCDTPLINTGCYSTGSDAGNIFQTDTGDRFDGSYLNFNYQLTNGYAGFKLFWDNGVTAWNATDYDSMYLVHKGPLQGQKVMLFWARSPSVGNVEWQPMGEFKASIVWKKETIPFPGDFGDKAALFELRVLIYNDSGVINPIDATGNLKIDNIAFVNGPGGPARPFRLATPALSYPVNFSTIPATIGLLLTWGASDSATRYQIHVSKYLNGSGFTTVLDSSLTGRQFDMAPYLPHETTLFNWRVRAKNQTDSSEWSSSWSFTVDPASSVRVASVHTTPKVSAMQKAGSTIITVALPFHCSNGRMTILSISGKKVAERIIAGSGLQTVTFSDIPPGVHFLRLTAGGKTVASKILKF